MMTKIRKKSWWIHQNLRVQTTSWSTNRLNIFAEANRRRWCHWGEKGSECVEEGKARKTNGGGEGVEEGKEIDKEEGMLTCCMP